MQKKNWPLIFIGIPVLILLWYFTIKKNDYSISFETKALPGEVAYRIDSPIFDNMEVINTEIDSNFSQVHQETKLNGGSYKLTWNIKSKNDTINQVKVGVNTKNNSFKARFLLLIGQNNFQQEMKAELQYFQKALVTNLDLYSVKIEGETVSPKNNCACINIENKIDHKAFDMMKTINVLSNYILDHELETEGRPRIIINTWDKTSKNTNFDFCFPIAAMETYPEHLTIGIKNIPAEKSLKARFHGNYMFSHNAWFHLMDYAEKNNLAFKSENILEIFKDNPQMGGDESQWEAEIYLPLAE